MPFGSLVVAFAISGCVSTGGDGAPASDGGAGEPADARGGDLDARPSGLPNLDGGPCDGLDAHLTPPCTEGRTGANGPFCWGGREHYRPPGFQGVSGEDCVDHLYVGDLEPQDPDPRCPPDPVPECAPDLLNLVCVYDECPAGYRALGCDGSAWIDLWRTSGCR